MGLRCGLQVPMHANSGARARARRVEHREVLRQVVVPARSGGAGVRLNDRLARQRGSTCVVPPGAWASRVWKNSGDGELSFK